MKTITFLLTFGLFAYQQTQAQPDTTFKPSGKPIIQVFGNFDFNATKDAQKQYGFWFGRAHFGYEYQFNK